MQVATRRMWVDALARRPLCPTMVATTVAPPRRGHETTRRQESHAPRASQCLYLMTRTMPAWAGRRTKSSITWEGARRKCGPSSRRSNLEEEGMLRRRTRTTMMMGTQSSLESSRGARPVLRRSLHCTGRRPHPLFNRVHGRSSSRRPRCVQAHHLRQGMVSHPLGPLHLKERLYPNDRRVSAR